MAYSLSKDFAHLLQTFFELVNLVAKFYARRRTCIFSERKQSKHVLNEMGVDNRTPSERCLIREKMFVAFKDVENVLTKKAQYVKNAKLTQAKSHVH